jgi:hypothetical protein
MIVSKPSRVGTAIFVAASLLSSCKPPGPPVYSRAEIDRESQYDHVTKLMSAAARGHLDGMVERPIDWKYNSVRLLLSQGANPNLGNTLHKITPLMLAVYFGHAPVVEALLQGGASLDARDAEGRTAIDYATLAGQKEIAEMLAARGARTMRLGVKGEKVIGVDPGDHTIRDFLFSVSTWALPGQHDRPKPLPFDWQVAAMERRVEAGLRPTLPDVSKRCEAAPLVRTSARLPVVRVWDARERARREFSPDHIDRLLSFPVLKDPSAEAFTLVLVLSERQFNLPGIVFRLRGQSYDATFTVCATEWPDVKSLRRLQVSSKGPTTVDEAEKAGDMYMRHDQRVAAWITGWPTTGSK